MKKSEAITLFCGIGCLVGLFAFFGISSKIAKAEREAKKAQEALVVMEQRETYAREQVATQAERLRLKEVEERERLQDNWEWVQTQDSLPIYKRFATRFPNHPEIEAIQKRIIDLEVKEIAAGEYGEMPKAQPLSYGGSTVDMEIENKTGYVLTVRYSGTNSKMIVLPVASTESITLVPGDYQVAASVSASNVTNYYGRDTMQGGKYSSSFFIQTRPR
jgi:hypothetical protein